MFNVAFLFQVYREAGLKNSKHPEVEGMLYDKLCQIGKHKLRDDVRKMALSIALSVSVLTVHNFKGKSFCHIRTVCAVE